MDGMSGHSLDPILAYPFAKEHGIVLMQLGETALLGVRVGFDPRALLEARRALGRPIDLLELEAADFDKRLSEVYAVGGLSESELAGDDESDDLSSLIEGMPETADLLDADDDAPVIRLINGIIAEAVRIRASDIHVEPFESGLSVRLRIDGVLQEIAALPARLSPVITSRLKVMARLDIAEKRIPQDGRIGLTLGGKSLDVRVSTLPARHGERVVLRILDKDQAHFDLDHIGMSPKIRDGYERALAQPNGIILVTGPTGSGKTTTLYAGLNALNDRKRNILTVEDPVEYALDGVGQTQVNAKVGMTFAAGLRAILRQDPDVVMVGEIRDLETVEIAIQASLTGHLVLSTVHTNSAIAAITRLRDMGVEPFLLASTMKFVMAQRLVRRLCNECKVAHAPDPKETALLQAVGRVPDVIYRAGGCPACNKTGYAGRIGIYELVEIDDDLRRMIHENASEDAMEAFAFRDADTLSIAGMRHVAAGHTALEEVVRVTRQDRSASKE